MVTKMEVRFSIIVPIYNSEDFLDDCITSVLNQTFRCFELILVDDGSEDQSLKICEEYSESDSRVFVFHKENSGPLDTREYGISKAKGEYCLFLDSDDKYDINTLERIDNEIKQTGADCLIFGLKVVRDDKIIAFGPSIGDIVITDKKELFNIVFYYTGFNSMSRKAIKRDLLTKENFKQYIHIANGEDLLESLRVYEKAEKVAFISDPLYIYNQIDSSNTHVNRTNNILDSFEVDDVVYNFLRASNALDDADIRKYRIGRMAALITQIKSAINSIDDINELRGMFSQIKENKHCTELLKEYEFSKLKMGDSIVLLFFKYDRYNLLRSYVKSGKSVKSFIKRLTFSKSKL